MVFQFQNAGVMEIMHAWSHGSLKPGIDKIHGELSFIAKQSPAIEHSKSVLTFTDTEFWSFSIKVMRKGNFTICHFLGRWTQVNQETVQYSQVSPTSHLTLLKRAPSTSQYLQLTLKHQAITRLLVTELVRCWHLVFFPSSTKAEEPQSQFNQVPRNLSCAGTYSRCRLMVSYMFFPEPQGAAVEVKGVHLATVFWLSVFVGDVRTQVHLLIWFFFARGSKQPFPELHKWMRHKAKLHCSALILMLPSPCYFTGL